MQYIFLFKIEIEREKQEDDPVAEESRTKQNYTSGIFFPWHSSQKLTKYSRTGYYKMKMGEGSGLWRLSHEETLNELGMFSLETITSYHITNSCSVSGILRGCLLELSQYRFKMLLSALFTSLLAVNRINS